MAIYTVFETSSGRFRIQVTYPQGFTLFVGGSRSRRFCFWTREAAQKVADEYNAAEVFLKNYVTEEETTS